MRAYGWRAKRPPAAADLLVLSTLIAPLSRPRTVPLDPPGGVFAWTKEFCIYELMPDGELDRRDSRVVRGRPADPTRRRPVLAKRRFGRGSHPRATFLFSRCQCLYGGHWMERKGRARGTFSV